jgi:hypothetical protein
MVAETLPEHCQQPVAVHHFFLAHLLKHFRRRRVGLPQSVCEFAVDTPVLFFRRYRQRQNLLLG